MIYHISTQVNYTDQQLSSLEWLVLQQLDGVKNILEVSRGLGVEIKKMMFTFYCLMEKNLIKLVESADEEYMEVEHIENMETELTKIVGPVAQIIIDDILLEMNMARSTIKRNMVFTFVEAVSNEITDESKQLEFQEIMLFIFKKVMF